ncbi:MAG: glycosyl hydrolase family 3 [Clostridiales bacterium]|nr:glycosyl hydrolase family 3 [Clostridiales bacterium]
MKGKLSERPFYLNEAQIRWVEETAENLTEEQKIGQLFCVLGDEYALADLQEMIEKDQIGGILYRPAPAEQIREKYRALDAVAKIPLLKAANLEEGGAGGISDGTLFGWPMLVAATDDDEMVERFARVCAAEGRSIDVNVSFSPVCDLDLNYLNPITNVRTFGSDQDRVTRFTEIYTKTLQEGGVAACAKHFPGDGVDYRDQHLHPTCNSLSAEDWYRSYGAIYQNLIEHDLLSVMVGHITQPAVSMDINPSLSYEDCLPASQSRELMTGVLREKYGFNGVITTDATIMGGYCMAMERKTAIPASIMAGCDMLVFNTDFQEDYRYMREAFAAGRLTRERLDKAVLRVLALKAKMCQIGENDAEATGNDTLTEVPAARWQKECADKAITLVKNHKPEVFPVTPEKYRQIRLITLGKDDIADGSVTEIAETLLQEAGFETERYEPFADDLHGTGNLDEKRLTLYLANYETASNQTTVRVNWCPKHALDMPRFVNEEDSIFVSFANPYHLQDVLRIRTYINAYTATKATITAVIEKLMGQSAFTGVSPVDAYCGLPDTRL